MDLVSLIGGLLSIGAILTGVFIEKIPITQILSPFPLVFVTLGTLGAVLLSFPWRRVKAVSYTHLTLPTSG